MKKIVESLIKMIKKNRLCIFKLKILITMFISFSFFEGFTQSIYRVKDIKTGELSSNIGSFTKMQGKAYFWATDTVGQQIWVTDGSENGTYKITNLEIPAWSNAPVTVSDSLLIFISSNGQNGLELFYSDGTIGSGEMLVDLNEGDNGGIVQFGRGDGSYAYLIGKEPRGMYRTDGTAEGTIGLTSGGEDGLREMLPFNGSNFTRIFRNGDTWLLKTDGTTEGTEFITQIVEGQVSPPILNIVTFNNFLYFLKESPNQGWGLWRSDGTIEGMQMVVQLNPEGFYSPYGLVATNEKLFFAANDGINGTEIWVSDGTTEGTEIITDYNDLNTSELPGSFTPFGNKLLFKRNDILTGYEMWISDGSIEGTHIVKDIWHGEESSNINLSKSIILDSLIFFPANSPNGRELWRSNGTEDGTFMVMDVCPDSCGSFPDRLFKLDDKRFLFRAYTPDTGAELWIYNHEIETNTSELLEQNRFFFNVYPNPSSNSMITLNWSENIAPSCYQILNLDGRIMKANYFGEQFNEIQVTINDFPPGLYFIKLCSADGAIIGQRKLVVF